MNERASIGSGMGLAGFGPFERIIALTREMGRQDDPSSAIDSHSSTSSTR
jgi:hypothetical protein